MSDAAIYAKFIDAIIADKVRVFGQAALERARQTPGLKLDDSVHTVIIHGNPKVVMKEILVQFEKIGGKVSSIMARKSLYNLKLKYPDIDLPDILK